MRTRTGQIIHRLLERFFPERRLFLRSEYETRFIRLKPETQLVAILGSALVVGWAIVATAIILMDSIGSGNFREQAKRDQRTYQARLNDLSAQRDARAEEALAAQQRFNAALEQISVMQSELLASETRRHELETGIELIHALRDEGRTVVMVEHVMDAIRSLCDRCVVMSSGAKIAEGTPDEVLSDREVVRAYLGDDDA